MSWTTESAFDAFYDAINLPGDHRELANTRAGWIERKLKGAGVDTLDSFPMGSIPRFTALKDYSDLDVLAVLHFGKHIKGRKPSQVLSTVREALAPGAGTVRRNGQAVTIRFQSWPDVDVVPASRVVDGDGNVARYEIPDMNREVWLSTKPRSHSREVATAAGERGPIFRRAITMLKDWNRRQDVSIQSFHLEVISLKVNCQWSDHSWPILQWFDQARSHIDFCWHDNQDVSSYLDWSRAQTIRAQLDTAYSQALAAWSAFHSGDHATAIRMWRKVFGQKFPNYG